MWILQLNAMFAFDIFDLQTFAARFCQFFLDGLVNYKRMAKP